MTDRDNQHEVMTLIAGCEKAIAAAIMSTGIPRHDQLFEEARNAALFEIWRSFSTYSGDRQVCAWMWGVARNVTQSRILGPTVRWRKLQTKLQSVATLESFVSRGSEEQTADRDLLARLLTELSEEFREILLLKLGEGLSDREVAQRLMIAEGTVSSRFSRAKAAALVVLRRLDAG